MRRKLTVSRTVPGLAADAAARFRNDPSTWLPTPLRRQAAGHWQVYLWAGRVGVLVDCAVGEAVRTGPVTGRRVQWRALHGEADSRASRAVPELDGDLLLVDRGDAGAELTLTGLYVPPAGMIGGVLDRLGLGGVAQATGRVFIAAVVDRLGDVVRPLASEDSAAR